MKAQHLVGFQYSAPSLAGTKTLNKLAIFLTLIMLSAITAWAQIGTGIISGLVTDSSGAVIPGANVSITNTETQFHFAAVTNAEGLYRVISLQPGPYQVIFESQGFKRLVRENIALRTGEVLAVNAELEVGSLTDSIEVTAAPPLLETETSTIGTAVKGETVYKLPLYQRYINSTLLLVPGLNTRGFAYGGGLGGFNVAGQRSGQIGVFLDGVGGNDQMTGQNTVLPIQNSVAEVKVVTGVPSAEYGHTAAGVIDVVKKTGTNEFHGMASVYGRTRRMAHRNYFDVLRNSQPREGAPNGMMVLFLMPDANVGGPVVLPKIYNGRDKTFFFFSTQKLVDKQTQQYVGAVPNAAMKQGDFSFGGIGNPIYDPATTRQLANGAWTRDRFADNKIPAARIDPVARKILQIDPWVPQNMPGSLNASGPVDNLLYDRKGQAYFDQFNGRLDHQFSPYKKIYGSYEYYHQAGPGRPSNMRIKDFDAGGGQSGFGYAETPFTQQHYSIGGTWVINPTLVNDTRVGYYRRRDDRFVPIYNQDWGKQLGIPNISSAMMPAIGSGNQFTPETAYGFTWTGPSRNIGETLSLRNDLSKVAGKHAFKMGYEVLRNRLNAWSINKPSGDFYFDGMTAGLQADGNVMPRTGNTFAGFLAGYVRQATFDQQLSSWLPRSWIQSFYFQDAWKATRTLTINAGLRYSNESPFSTKYGDASNFDPLGTDSLTGGRGAIIHRNALNKRDNNNFQPRLGLAWNPIKKWVFRSGFSLSTIDVKFPALRAQSDELVAQANQQRAPGDPRPLYRISDGPDAVLYNIKPNGTSPFLGTNYSGRTVDYWDPNLRNPYVMNWNASIQHELTPNYLLDLTYEGSSGVGLLEQWNINTFPVDYGANDATLRNAAYRASQNYRPFPQFGDIRMRSNFGHSSYHAGTLKLEKRYSRGFTLITFYTYSKALDSQDSDSSSSGVAPIQNRSLEKARAGYDRTHRWMTTTTYELPMGQGRRFLNHKGVVDYVIGGWEIAWVQAFESGNPLDFSFSNSPYNYFPTYAGIRRPNLVSQPSIRDGWRDLGGDRFNSNNSNAVMDISAFAYPAAFTPGNAGRNIITGLPLIYSMASAQKNIRLKERFSFQIRWDMQQVLKTYNFNPPTTTVDFLNPKTFGKITGAPSAASFGGLAIQNITLKLSW